MFLFRHDCLYLHFLTRRSCCQILISLNLLARSCKSRCHTNLTAVRIRSAATSAVHAAAADQAAAARAVASSSSAAAVAAAGATSAAVAVAVAAATHPGSCCCQDARSSQRGKFARWMVRIRTPVDRVLVHVLVHVLVVVQSSSSTTTDAAALLLLLLSPLTFHPPSVR